MAVLEVHKEFNLQLVQCIRKILGTNKHHSQLMLPMQIPLRLRR
jgi:hypothetical protein